LNYETLIFRKRELFVSLVSVCFRIGYLGRNALLFYSKIYQKPDGVLFLGLSEDKLLLFYFRHVFVLLQCLS